MAKETRTCQIIICMKCKNPGGTMVQRNGVYEHPNCKRPVSREYLERVRKEQEARAETKQGGEEKREDEFEAADMR